MKKQPGPQVELELERCRGVLREHGVKLTHQRLEIFRELVQRSDHPSAEDIYHGVRERIPTVSLDTVYRTLWLMIDLGLIATLGPPRERMRFDANLKRHHHFVCTRCGRTQDLVSAQYDALAVPHQVRELGKVEQAQVELLGLCTECLNKANH